MDFAQQSPAGQCPQWQRARQWQPDEKLLICGTFSGVGGVTRNNIARLNANNTLDQTFNPDAAGPVRSMAVLTDGRIIIGGELTGVGGVARGHIERLNAGGS